MNLAQLLGTSRVDTPFKNSRNDSMELLTGTGQFLTPRALVLRFWRVRN
jgi:hypothetical protein